MQANADWFGGDKAMAGNGVPELEPAEAEASVAATIDRPGSDAAANEAPSASAKESPPPEVPPRPFSERGTFVPVHKDELDPLEAEEPRPALISWQTWALAGALVAVGLGVWWSLQPPSADTLYARIQARVKDGSADSLPRKGSEIDDLQRLISRFRDNFPKDPRVAQLRAYERTLDLRRLEWKFDKKLARRTALNDLLPIEKLYYAAKSDARSDPARGAAELQALVDLYSQPDIPPGPTEDCLALARLRLPQVRREAEQFTREQLAVLNERLNAADTLRQREPEQSRKTYQAIVDLYGDKPWAAEVVRRARKSLKK